MSSNASSRLEFIESLRLLAALLVFFQHTIERYRDIALFDSLTQVGPGLVGVVIFFVVSGYVVPMSVKKGFEPASFMLRRIFRVYPLLLFAFALLLVAGASGFLANWRFMASATPGQWAANLLLVQDYVGAKPFLGVSWTLAIEFVWYVLFAGCLWRFGERAGGILNIAVPVGLLALAMLSLALGMRIPLGRIAMIYACVLGYQAYLYDNRLISATRLGWSIAAFLAVTWISNIVAFGVFKHSHVTMVQALWPWTLGPLAFFAVVLIEPLRNGRVLNSGWLPAWGAASYSIYLFHPIGLAFAEQYFHGDLVQILVAIAATALLAFVGYRYVEMAGVGLGRKVIGLVRSPKAGPVSVAR